MPYFVVGVAIIEVLIFRGTGGVRNKSHPYYDEPALVKAGHVGVSGVIEGKIIGFHPTPEAIDAVGGVEALINELAEYKPHPGRLQDDSSYFERAYELIDETNERTTVYTYAVDVPEETLNMIKSWYDDGKEVLYNFPNKEGEFIDPHTNCAMFWTQWFKIPLPVNTGSIQELTDYMKREEYETWQPNES